MTDLIGEKPLFIPLKRKYFDAFKRGDKEVEYRLYGKRWNEKTCRIGREAVLSLGYGKQDRLRGVVTDFAKLDPRVFDTKDAAAVIDVYGTLSIKLAGIKIKVMEAL